MACATDSAWGAAPSVAENFIRTASTQCISNLEAVWWGWDDPNATAEQVAVETAARKSLCALIRDLFGSPFHPVSIDPAWLTTNVVGLAQAIYEGRAFDRLPILADALEDAGCFHPDVLSHCRGPGPHVRGCWLVDLLLGKS